MKCSWPWAQGTPPAGLGSWIVGREKHVGFQRQEKSPCHGYLPVWGHPAPAASCLLPGCGFALDCPFLPEASWAFPGAVLLRLLWPGHLQDSGPTIHFHTRAIIFSPGDLPRAGTMFSSVWAKTDLERESPGEERHIFSSERHSGSLTELSLTH